jgi:hypothetical protein
MNRSMLTLIAILGLGTVGCAGVGIQPTSTLAANATIGYADRGLGDLWDAKAERPTGLDHTVTAKNVGGDLWNPASVARSWETEARKPEPKGLLSSVHTKLKF